MNRKEVDSNTETFVRRWSVFTGGDPRREEMLRRVAGVHECMVAVLGDPKARAGEKVRAGEAALKSIETFARATRLNLRDSAEGQRLDSWSSLLEFVKGFHAAYAKAEHALRQADEEGFAEYRRRYDDFLREQSASGDLVPGDLAE